MRGPTPAVRMIQIMFECSFENSRLEQFVSRVTLPNATSSLVSPNDFNSSVYLANCEVINAIDARAISVPQTNETRGIF